MAASLADSIRLYNYSRNYYDRSYREDDFMPDVPLQFPWQVAKDGYSWVDSHPIGEGRQDRRSFLSDNRAIGAGGLRVMQYQPLAAFPGLFRVFADTEANQDGIKAFADRFGPLGGDLAKQIQLSDQPKGKGVLVGTGEALAAWSIEILTMRFAIDIWEAARNGDVGRLEHVISWTEDGSRVQILSHPELPKGQLPNAPARVERASIASTQLGDGALERFVRGDLVKPALHYVQSTINEKLQGRASPRLLWDAKRERLGLYIVPAGLIGALWLQFARAVERDSRFRQCAECGTWFELAPGASKPIASGRPRRRACTAKAARSLTSPAIWRAIPTPCTAGSSASVARRTARQNSESG
jgi:hypothetical protein